MEQPDNTTADKAARRKKIIGAITGVVAFYVAYFAVQQIFFKAPSFDKAMMHAASELNKTCPVMADKETRLDNAVAFPGNIFQYNYTLVNIKKANVDPEALRKAIEPGIIDGVKTSPDLKAYRDNKVTMAYNYKDKDGVFILKISVTPDMYAEQ